MTIYDISAPHDLRAPMGKPAMTTEELDAYFADPNADEDIKGMLLLDVQRQGYGLPVLDWKVVLRSVQPDETVSELELVVTQANGLEIRKRINELAPAAWRARFSEDPPANLSANYEPM